MASVTVLLAVLLLATTISADMGFPNALESRQASGPLQWFKPGVNCTQRQEGCLGTVAWCSNAEYYRQIEGYPDQASCFNARMAKTEWQYISSGCLQHFEVCDGTDIVCSKVENMGTRRLCYGAHIKGKWLEPFSPGCLAPARHDDERCIGTRAFCESKERIKAYGSAQYCLAKREEASSEAKKQEFLAANPLRCTGDPTEICIGTEQYCTYQSKTNKEKCFASREQPPFYIEYSPDCETGSDKGYYSEACVGTESWCRSNARYQIYGSVEKCIQHRKRPSRLGKWLAPNETCAPNTQGTEACEGTERMCQKHSPWREVCFQERETAPFVQPDPRSCSEAKQQQEACLGTDVWCHEKWEHMDYYGEAECFSRRGFDQFKLAAEMAKLVTTAARPAIVKFGEKVTRDAVYYNLIGKRGNDKTALQAVKTYLEGYLTRIEDKVIPEAATKFMAEVERRAMGA
ncbi:hypothetical protein CDD81_3388 [Ophiocordyceps australis]|uniref:Uncharacterized protein n=1 Tax=Ophiocordyceps australis TaxID=1399860 RepID=A0A2C5X790_9HYPO|nr:hypothetical protein CDD81_3388 [Ophiocordyceps australis]